MMLFKRIIAISAIVAFLSGCTNDSTSDLIDTTPVENATYTEHIKPIITDNCIMCHSNPPQNGAPIPLTTYQNVKDAVETHGLIDRISRPQGAPGMMPNGGTRLPQNLIDLIIQWEDQGFQE
jgi:uncharacterized membrane protein